MGWQALCDLIVVDSHKGVESGEIIKKNEGVVQPHQTTTFSPNVNKIIGILIFYLLLVLL
jgi:hypothetical protein